MMTVLVLLAALAAVTSCVAIGWLFRAVKEVDHKGVESEGRLVTVVLFTGLLLWIGTTKLGYFVGASDQEERLRPALVVGLPMTVLGSYRHPTDSHWVTVVGWKEGQEHKVSWLDTGLHTEEKPFLPVAGQISLGQKLIRLDNGEVASWR